MQATDTAPLESFPIDGNVENRISGFHGRRTLWYGVCNDRLGRDFIKGIDKLAHRP